MSILKPALIIFLSLSICLNIYLGIKLIDSAISLDHRNQALKYQDKETNVELEILSQLLINNITRQEITAISDEMSAKGVIVKSREDLLQIGSLEISFNGDKVATVEKF